jgi:hypothetical protein
MHAVPTAPLKGSSYLVGGYLAVFLVVFVLLYPLSSSSVTELDHRLSKVLCEEGGLALFLRSRCPLQCQ